MELVKVIKAATMKSTVVWVMTPCNEVDLYERFGGTAIHFRKPYGVTCQRTGAVCVGSLETWELTNCRKRILCLL
jgi:hypothetical protein